jgi:uncharacterized protein YkwD
MLGATAARGQSLSAERRGVVLNLPFVSMIYPEVELIPDVEGRIMGALFRRTISDTVSRHRFLSLAATAAVAGAVLLTAVACTPQQAMEMNLALGLNAMRADNGLPPLTMDPDLAEVARYRAEDMAAKGYFSHAPPDGCDYRCLFNKNGVSTAWSGEVISWNNYPMKDTVSTTLRMWRDSPGHFSVITNRCFTRMGTGAAVAKDGRIYHVAVFEGLAPGC